MNHPYREPPPPIPTLKEWPHAARCWPYERRLAWAAEGRCASWRTTAIALLVAHVTFAGAALVCVQANARMMAAIDRLDAATVEAMKSARSPAPLASTPSAPAPLIPDMAEWPVGLSLVRLGAAEFLVDRRTIGMALEREADRMRMARIVPESENGRVVGIRLFGVTPDSLLGRFGFENGDRLESINGVDLCTPGRALETYARLRTTDEVSVLVYRRGSRVRLEYHVV
jgi:general secretion pathway protein C